MVIEKGYAKVNLGLEVVRKREDGYHELDMIMTSINLYDELYFEDNENSEIVIECEEVKINLENNLVYKAIIALKEAFKIDRGVKVKIIKRIPLQAGLGGGSADCAATLRAINRLWNLELSNEELAEIGFKLGSDVPFCIYNQTARVRGRGEKLEFIEEIPFTYFVLVTPPFSNSTAAVFKDYLVSQNIGGRINHLKEAVEEGTLDRIAELLFNDLEKNEKELEIAEIKSDLLVSGAIGSVMSGSGSSVIGLCLNSLKNAQQVLSRYNNIINKKYANAHKWKAEIYSTRSSRRAAKTSTVFIESKPKELKMLSQTKTKAFAMLPLGYKRILDHYKVILTPLSVWENITIQKLNQPHAELYFSDGSSYKSLELALNGLSQTLGYGLRVTVKNDINTFGLINDNNYLNAIINALSDFGTDPKNVLSFYSNNVKLYKNYQTIAYDSKTDKFENLGNAVFGYVLLVDLKIANYQSPRYTKQANIDLTQLNVIKDGISEANFYKIATNTFNGLEKFETRKIGEYRGNNYLEKIKNTALNNGATGVYLAVGGNSLVIICRYEKQMHKISNLLKHRFSLDNIVETSLKTKIIHKESKSKILKVIPSLSIDEEYEYDDSSPFENFEEIDRETYRRSKKRKPKEIITRREDCEG
ncbi:MAG: 4-(cytidine 5'-diphospho)-2-C-methyl-D-erythritol kinase, partial [Bacilli bacterium]|nr:4-(cytidine 5'-diphospho)-2-C-methyl-D-erythritol kinase [Bacilli bacterium]